MGSLGRHASRAATSAPAFRAPLLVRSYPGNSPSRVV